jgi:hypothetical protein
MVRIFDNSEAECMVVQKQRMIFEGGQQFTEYENEQLEIFLKYIKDSNLPRDERMYFRY